MKPMVLLGLIGLTASAATAQGRPLSRSDAAALDCRACHTAVTPTKDSPALAACPRLKIKGYHAVDDAPAIIRLGTDGATYGPVTFAHRAHAHMAETGKGCTGCHHYDQVRPIQKCKNCHAVSRVREDLNKPDLKAAMHRQCLECHREWNPTGSCSTCHARDGAAGAKVAAGAKAVAGAKVAAPTRASAVAEPVRVVYETGAKEGKTVTFFHKDHTTRFALACAQCHQNESCRGCHDRKRLTADNAVITRRTAAGLTDEQAHARCATCHVKDECSTCHKGMSPRTIGFDHLRRTGFALNRFHAPLECARCHKGPPPYKAMSADCESCHKGWQARFGHGR
ncbi:MAG: cytochrome c3 family protein, partial [Gemmatimonadaceae bacterium]